MKALVYETAHTLDNFAIGLQEVAEPTVREFDVLVEIHAIAINPNTLHLTIRMAAQISRRGERL
jgi:NADPH:quinone reductase-like Zn-dependent oxidoreductase